MRQIRFIHAATRYVARHVQGQAGLMTPVRVSDWLIYDYDHEGD